jgi:holliday junction DNA helicase RuvA
LARLTRIPGIGKKTAERMVLELRDKLPAATGTSAPSAPAMSAVEEDVLSALMNLGYQRPLAEKALSNAVKNGLGKDKDREKNGSFDSLFREALSSLSK